jgi:hypothetical protein
MLEITSIEEIEWEIFYLGTRERMDLPTMAAPAL